MSTEPEVIEAESNRPTPAPERRSEVEPADPKKEKTPPGPPKSLLREYFESAVVTVIMALFGITFVVQAVKVPTGSMQNNIKIGDHLLVNKFIFAPHNPLFNWLPYRDVRRGDIIVFKYPGDPSINFVKRVIGLPGEKIEIRGTKIFINDKLLPEEIIWAQKVHEKAELKPLEQRESVIPPDSAYQEFYQNEPIKRYTVYYQLGMHSPYEDSFAEFAPEAAGETAETEPCPFNEEAIEGNPGVREISGRKMYGIEAPCVIQPGQYFAIGDNRDDSHDGRYWGTVPRENIIGRALIVYWSLDESGEAFTSEESDNPFVAVFSRVYYGAKYFIKETRWRDTGRLIK